MCRAVANHQSPTTEHRTPARYLAPVLAGLFLATLPFWRYLPLGGALGAHMDHEPRHGGQLGMVGDHHIEVVRRRGRVEVYISDARRVPVMPQSARVIFDHVQEEPLVWQNHRLTATDRTAAILETRVVLTGGTELTISFDFSDEA